MKIQQRTKWALRLTCSYLVAAGALGWCGCGGEPKPITSQTSKYQVADENPAAENQGAPGGDAHSTIPFADGASPAANGSRRPAFSNADTSESAASPRTQDLAGSSDPSTEPATAKGAPAKPSSQPPTASDEAPKAADGAQGLLAHIEKLQARDPRAATREESLNNLTKIQREIVETANQILSSTADEASLVRAAEAKVGSLTLLAQIPQIQREAQAELKAFVAELKKSSHAKLARLANRMEFAQQMDAFASGEAVDVPKLLAHFKQLFAEEEKDEALFALSQQVTQIFLSTRHSQEAKEIMKLIADTFSGHREEKLANASKMFREQLLIIEVNLNEKLNAALEGKPKAEEEFLATLDKLLADRELGAATLQVLGQIAQLIETQNLELADKTYAKMVAAFTKQSPPEVAKAIQEIVANFSKRKAIIGQPFVVEGITLDGRPFDWSKFQGKVVLVDFWATWCQPCLDEIPNIKRNYDQYHGQGFEVVGVNLDDDPETVQRFFSRQRLPWPTLLSPDPKKAGFEHPLAVKCGVEAIPFLVLVDRDGKALALNLRGEDLGKKLASMFSSPGPSQSNPLRKTPAKKSDGKAG